MKKLMICFSVLMTSSFVGAAQNTADVTKVESVVRQFAQAGDQQDAALLDKILHPMYRTVAHRVFGATDASLMDKATYLQLIQDKKIGGDAREVLLLQLDLGNNVATVKAIFQGKALKFTTFLSLLKLENGDWQIVGDMPEIEKV